MSGLVAVVAITRSAAREHVDNRSVLTQLVKRKIEEAGTLSINHHNVEHRLSSQQCCQRFQLKLRLQINLSASQLWRQFVFPPKILSGAGKDGLSPGMPAQVRGQIEDAIQVGMKRPVLADGGSTLQARLDNI